MQHHMKQARFGYEVWIEDGDEVVCEAKVLSGPSGFLIETIDTPPKHRRKGYARSLVMKLKELADNHGINCEPIAIKKTPEAQGFWASMGMKDGLGEEDEPFQKP